MSDLRLGEACCFNCCARVQQRRRRKARDQLKVAFNWRHTLYVANQISNRVIQINIECRTLPVVEPELDGRGRLGRVNGGFAVSLAGVDGDCDCLGMRA